MARPDPPGAGPADAAPALTANLTLRFGHQRLRARVYWPPSGTATARPSLGLVVPGSPTSPWPESADTLGRGLCLAAAIVVLAPADGPGAAREPYDDPATAVLEWATEHAGELGASLDRLLVAGHGSGAARAARIAVSARARGWPPLLRQVLVHPRFTATHPMPSSITGVAPATVVSDGAGGDDGERYAARLRRWQVGVDELRHPADVLPGPHPEQPAMFLSLARSLRGGGAGLDHRQTKRSARRLP